MAEDAAFAIVDVSTSGRDPIFTERTRENAPAVNRELIASIRRG